MAQSKKASVAEAIINIAIGMGIALGSQYVIFPIVGIHVTHSVHIQITIFFTVISFIRSYLVRRWFTKRVNAWLDRMFPNAEV